jgi:hypothetical protein
MNVNTDKKELNGRLTFWVMLGTVGSCAVLFLLEGVGFWYQFGLLVIVAYFVVRGILASKGQ